MKKLVTYLLMSLLILGLAGCSASSMKNIEKELTDQLSNIADAENKYVLMVKNGHRENNPNLTYSAAFENFFGTPTWKYIKTESGENVVEFTGDCTYQDTQVKARLQFIVDEEAGKFEAGYLGFNEVPQSALIRSALLEKVFGSNVEAENAPTVTEDESVNNNSSSYEYSEATFFRTDYFNNITYEDLLRYPDNYSYNKVYFERCEIVQILEPKLYLVVKEVNFTNKYIVIDDRASNGANAMVNDTVTVYGEFYWIDTLTNTNGYTEQVPYINADRLIINDIDPTDMEDFTKTVVEFLNIYNFSFSSENEYLSGQRANIICKVYRIGDYGPVILAPYEYVYGNTALPVDGYRMDFITRYERRNIASDINEIRRLPIDITIGNLYLITGTISISKSHSAIYFDVENIELYEDYEEYQ